MKDENSVIATYVMCVFWGLGLGWYYSVQTAFFSVIMPQEKATEMSGLFSFCLTFLSWFPPLIFTIMNENGIHMRFGLLHLVAYFLLAALCLSAMPDWEDILNEAHLKIAEEEKKDEESPLEDDEVYDA